MSTKEVILVGGFLGAGKTTLLGRAAERLAGQGRRVALVTNDQAANLVDTATLEGTASGVREVAGGCFCCRFPDLLTAMETLAEEFDPHVYICEPVGSCTDISATVIQPLKKLCRDRYRLRPFSVLLDPDRAIEALDGEPPAPFPGNVLYIYRKQVEEADVLVINKQDATPPDKIERVKGLLARHFPETPVVTMSALTGAGIDPWLDLLRNNGSSGRHIAEVDYDEYAEGEAALGWLNAKVELAGAAPIDWRDFCERLMDSLQRRLRQVDAEAAHVKFRLTSGDESLTANLTSTSGKPTARGTLEAGGRKALLVFNARVRIEPDALRAAFETALQSAAGDALEIPTRQIESFAPARPQPTHRFDQVVGEREA